MIMIASVQEFLNLIQDGTESSLRQARCDVADSSVWFYLIAEHPDLTVDVAMNKSLPEEVKHALVDHCDPRVRYFIAMHGNLNHALLLRLSKDLDESVRLRVAYNKRTPADIIDILKLDSSLLVREVACERARAAKAD